MILISIMISEKNARDKCVCDYQRCPDMLEMLALYYNRRQITERNLWYLFRFYHASREVPTAMPRGRRRALRATRYVMVIIPCRRPCWPQATQRERRQIPRDAKWSFWKQRRTFQKNRISPPAPPRTLMMRLCERKPARYANVFLNRVKLRDIETSDGGQTSVKPAQ